MIFSWWGLFFCSSLVVIITYGEGLTFPFLADDFFQFLFVEEHSLAEIWRTAEGLQYFRPLTFTLWKLFKLFMGSHNPVLLHAINLLLHLVNGIMVGWLAPPQEDYALGEEGVLILSSYKELEGLMQLYGGQSGQIEAVHYHDIRETVPYHVGLTGQGPDWNRQVTSVGKIYVTRYYE